MPHYSRVERHSRAVILRPQETEIIQPFDDEHRSSNTPDVLHVHQDRTGKLDLDDRCKTSSSNECRKKLFLQLDDI